MMRLREVRITSGSKLSGLVVTQISRNVLSSSAMLYFENGMGGVQLLQETDESFTGGAYRRDAQMDAEQGIHAVVRDDGSYKAVAARRNGGDESHGILSSWVSLRWKKFRSLSSCIFRKCRLYVLPGLKLITLPWRLLCGISYFIHYTMGAHKMKNILFL